MNNSRSSRAGRPRGRSASIDALEPRRLLAVNAVINVLDNDTTIYTGQSVHVDALQSTPGQADGNDVLTARYDWDFGDRTNGKLNPSALYNNLPGFNAAHVYDTPGTYILKLTVTDANGSSDVDTKTITVSQPSNLYSIYVDANGGSHGANTTTVTTVSGIQSALNSAKSGDITRPVQILFERGQTFGATHTGGPPINLSNYQNVWIEPDPASMGSDPLISFTPSANNNAVISADNSTHVTIDHLQFISTVRNNGEAVSAGHYSVIRNCTVPDNSMYQFVHSGNTNSPW